MSVIEETTKTILKGSEFIVSESDPSTVFIPEDINEEQVMVRAMVQDFISANVTPVYEKIEKQENNISRDLLGVAGDLGLLGSHIPESYGGMQMDTNSNTIITEEIGRAGSFSVSVAAHTGIGMLPIFYFGTEAQKQKYLPGLASGQLVASYCLTEPSSGSDALAAKTKAILTEDGEHYRITGQKNVDYECRFCRHIHCICTGRRRQIYRFLDRERCRRAYAWSRRG